MITKYKDLNQLTNSHYLQSDAYKEGDYFKLKYQVFRKYFNKYFLHTKA